MAFFENLGAKVSEAGNKIADTARNNNQIIQLQNEIQRLQTEMDDAFKGLGFLLYDKMKSPDGPEPDYQQYVDRIDSLNEERNRAMDELDFARGIARCPNCGAEVPAGSLFCAKCGSKIATAAARNADVPKKRICPGCGREYEEGSRFCVYCGHSLAEG